MTSEPNSRKEMTLVREFDAPRERVWEAWTTPESFSFWFGGSTMAVPMETISMDVRPGGAWKATMVPTTGALMPFTGTYLEVQKPERLVMTFADVHDPTNQHVEVLTVTLVEKGNKTEVTLHQAGHMSDEEYPKLVVGYGTFMDALAELLENLQ